MKIERDILLIKTVIVLLRILDGDALRIGQMENAIDALPEAA